MPVRVELTGDAEDDLARYARSGSLERFLTRLIRLEEVGKDAGVPLGRGLTGWRKMVVGDRDWRIVFRMNEQDTVATVWVIGDRADEECYRQAQSRAAAAGGEPPAAASLATVLLRLMQAQRRQRGR
jgi:mRNA interferase RelE/StbE